MPAVAGLPELDRGGLLRGSRSGLRHLPGGLQGGDAGLLELVGTEPVHGGVGKCGAASRVVMRACRGWWVWSLCMEVWGSQRGSCRDGFTLSLTVSGSR